MPIGPVSRAVRCAALVFAVCGSFSVLAQESDTRFQGLLRERDISVFGFRRLDMQPTHAMFLAPGTFTLETTLGYQNTFAMSENVVSYLRTRPAGTPITVADVAAIRALPGESYLVDQELGTLDLTGSYQFDRHWSGSLTLGMVRASGGIFDSSIEKFHAAFGLDRSVRESLARNQFDQILNLKGEQYTNINAGSETSPTNPVISVRYSLAEQRQPWNLVVEASVKPGIFNNDNAFSGGGTGAGLQITGQRFFDRHAFYLSLATVAQSASSGPFATTRQIIPTVIAGYEFRATDQTNLVAQVYAARSPFQGDQTDLAELRRTKYEVSLGFHHRSGPWVTSFALVENAINLNNTPDIGLQLTVAYSTRWLQ